MNDKEIKKEQPLTIIGVIHEEDMIDNEYLTEKPNYDSRKTGLKVTIYVDEKGAEKPNPHK